MLRFGRLSARARGDRLAAELLEHFERLRRRVAVLVLLWQTSHVGEPLNEWADVACDTLALGWKTIILFRAGSSSSRP